MRVYEVWLMNGNGAHREETMAFKETNKRRARTKGLEELKKRGDGWKLSVIDVTWRSVNKHMFWLRYAAQMRGGRVYVDVLLR